MDSILYSTLHRRPSVCKNRAIEYKKGRFLNVIFDSSNFATLIYQKIPQRSVHAECIIPICVNVSVEDAAHISLYNTRLAWAG